MIPSINPECPFPFYTSKEKQQFRWKECAGERPTGIFAPVDGFLPFQIFCDTDPGTVGSVKIYDENDVLILTVSNSDVSVISVDTGTDYFLTSSLGAIAWSPSLDCGKYYYAEIVMTGGTGLTYYSELFETISL